MNHFPSEINAWKNDVARRLVALRDGVDTIMMTMPMLPDPEIGMPFTGPLSPLPFVFPPPEENTGGTQYTAAGHCPQCPAALRKYELTVSGIAIRNCALCASLNGTFILTANDAQHAGSGSYQEAGCTWSSGPIVWCTPPAGQMVYWVMQVINDGPSSTPRVHIFWGSDPNGVTGPTTPDYRYNGCPPADGSGSGSITVTRTAGLILNDCRDYPLSVTLRGVT